MLCRKWDFYVWFAVVFSLKKKWKLFLFWYENQCHWKHKNCSGFKD